MDLEEWLNIYKKIVHDFGFSELEDEKAARVLHELASSKLLDSSVLDIIRGKNVAVVGGAYSGEKIEEDFIITAGKAIEKVNFIPDIHVTDIEEDSSLLAELEKRGCILVIHAHGDNIHRLCEVIPKLERFVGTTQVIPFDKVYNFGGFTDGDRAAIIAKKFGAKKISLYGFDFKLARDKVKQKKLRWAEKILKIEGII